MKVKELIQLLMDVNSEADVLIDNDGLLFPLDLVATEANMELTDPSNWFEVALVTMPDSV